MSKERINIEEIFNIARQKQIPTERTAYLDEVCRNRPEVRKRVEELLKADEAAGGFLEPPEATLEESPVIEGPGTRIGRYEILELIGEGPSCCGR